LDYKVSAHYETYIDYRSDFLHAGRR
jgi:hypothetical protein